GRSDLVKASTRQRRMLGGAMRQTGFFAAAALFGVEHHRKRLADDHEHARRLAEALARHRHVRIDLSTVQTNIVVFRLHRDSLDAATLVRRARDRGVLLNAFDERTVRAVTHLDVSRSQIDRAAEAITAALAA
ncbi:MAG: low specificity L-threonine aldolase, partial [Rhizobacter sp.]|nr:low specificity L-threonine aldolase [Rhizobacter sp.]